LNCIKAMTIKSNSSEAITRELKGKGIQVMLSDGSLLSPRITIKEIREGADAVVFRMLEQQP